MPRPKSTTSKTNGNGAKTSNGAKLDFEQTLWAAADKQRGHMDAAEYKHVVLGLIFLKYISDAFQEVYDKLDAEEYADPEDRDEYTAESRRTRDGLVICRFTDRSLTRRRGSCAR